MNLAPIPYTPFSELKEGDEFIRVAGRPVLLRDIRGEIIRNSGSMMLFRITGLQGCYSVHRLITMDRFGRDSRTLLSTDQLRDQTPAHREALS